MIRPETEHWSTTVSPQMITSARSQELPVRAEEPEMKVLLALTFLLAFLALGLSEPDNDRDVELLSDNLESFPGYEHYPPWLLQLLSLDQDTQVGMRA